MLIYYKIMKFLGRKSESICKKIEEKYEENAKKIAAQIPKEKKCNECQYGRYIESDCVLGCGYECKLNPLKPIALGFDGEHSVMMKERYIFDSVFPSEEVMEIALGKER